MNYICIDSGNNNNISNGEIYRIEISTVNSKMCRAFNVDEGGSIGIYCTYRFEPIVEGFIKF